MTPQLRIQMNKLSSPGRRKVILNQGYCVSKFSNEFAKAYETLSDDASVRKFCAGIHRSEVRNDP
jgi:hypothetical protein